jgi:threonine dehydrogenase-like Zn-dependent dehydrogenase
VEADFDWLFFGASQSDTLAVRFGRNVLVVGLGMVAVGITAVLSVAAFALVFALPRAVDPSRLDDV